MLGATFSGEVEAVGQVGSAVSTLPASIELVNREQPGLAPVHFIRRTYAYPIEVSRGLGVVVTTHKCHDIAAYLKIDPGDWLLTLASLGAVQWHVLKKYPRLHPEDFIHSSPDNCPFAHVRDLSSLILCLEKPKVCRGCVRFYQQLGQEHSLHTVNIVLQRISNAR